MKRSLIVLFLLIACVGIASAASKQWVHINVDKPREEEKVKINIPVSLVENLLPLVNQENMHHGTMCLNHHDIDVSELREAWKNLRAEGDGEYMTIEKRDMNLHVYTKSGFFYVQSDAQSRQQIDMKIPMDVVDALLSGKGDELNLTAAIHALEGSGVHDVLSVKNDEGTVRVWVDESNSAK